MSHIAFDLPTKTITDRICSRPNYGQPNIAASCRPNEDNALIWPMPVLPFDYMYTVGLKISGHEGKAQWRKIADRRTDTGRCS